MASQNQAGAAASAVLHLAERTVHDEQQNLAEQIGVVGRAERLRFGRGEALRALLREETAMVRKHVREIELDLLADLAVKRKKGEFTMEKRMEVMLRE